MPQEKESVHCPAGHSYDNINKRINTIADENQEKTIKSQKHELFSSSSESHLQSCYISRSIYTLHGLHNSLEDVKSGKSQELNGALSNLVKKSNNNIEDNIFQEFKIADENQEKAIKSQKHELFSSSSESHLQSCYISRSIHTLHGLHNSLEDIKSGKSQDPNLLIPTTSNGSTYDIDSKESQECIDWEKEIQNYTKIRPYSDISTLDYNSRESKECINLDNEDNITFKKIKRLD
ncbi:2987_t:CDS:2 [Diversispora eburnea]|uniref:2987_t:CDS:1 n=1 Tax=Diversispora eburnea TaxID=1213867 RepID=A0A9N9A1Z7_9GLOM|nr:2987_t:CDS:2 [Diversispora eburnea]